MKLATPHLDVASLRRDFPTLARRVDGNPLVYLDSAASSQTPRQVLEAMNAYYEHHRSNVHRGVYGLASEATDLYEGGRAAAARFVNGPVEGTVITRNATEAINLVAYSYVRNRLGLGDALLLSLMEHHANLVPWQQAAKASGFELRFLPLTPDGELDHSALPRLLDDGRVKFLAVTAMSNVLGTRNDVPLLARAVRDANPAAKVLVDGAQSVPHSPTDFVLMDADFLVFSGHKMLGPTGIGVLTARPELLEEMPPFLSGGEMIREVDLHDSTWNEIPHKFEAGTPAIAEAAGLQAAVEYLEAIGMDRVREHERGMTRAAIAALEGIPGVKVHGPRDPERRGAAISFEVEGIHPHDLGTVLDSRGVCIRVGHHCTKPLMRILRVPATARASFYIYNDETDLPPLVEGIEEARRFFAR